MKIRVETTELDKLITSEELKHLEDLLNPVPSAAPDTDDEVLELDEQVDEED